ncbi:MAG: hypothetical protein ABW085_00030, partial [Sedimenticola sp.]
PATKYDGEAVNMTAFSFLAVSLRLWGGNCRIRATDKGYLPQIFQRHGAGCVQIRRRAPFSGFFIGRDSVCL